MDLTTPADACQSGYAEDFPFQSGFPYSAEHSGCSLQPPLCVQKAENSGSNYEMRRSNAFVFRRDARNTFRASRSVVNTRTKTSCAHFVLCVTWLAPLDLLTLCSPFCRGVILIYVKLHEATTENSIYNQEIHGNIKKYCPLAASASFFISNYLLQYSCIPGQSSIRAEQMKGGGENSGQSMPPGSARRTWNEIPDPQDRNCRLAVAVFLRPKTKQEGDTA